MANNLKMFSLLALMFLCGCSTPLRTQTNIPSSGLKTRTIVLQGTQSRIHIVNALRLAGWNVKSQELSTNAKEVELSGATRFKNSTIELKETFKAVSANYLAVIEAQQSDVCIGLVGKSKGYTPHYSIFTLTIYDVETGDSLFYLEVGGCEEDVITKVEKGLLKLTS